MQEQEASQKNNSFKKFYEKYYKHLLIIPAALLIFSVIFLIQFNSQYGDIVFKDVSLTGGTTITVIQDDVNIDVLRESLRGQFPDVIVRGISDIRTGKQNAFFVETTAPVEEVKSALESFLGTELNSENSSTEFTGPSISTSFYQQLQIAILIAFVFMALVVFFIFKTPIPSLAVIVSAFADIVMTIVLIDIFQLSLSSAGIVALLMLIGYSVDTDILLTTRVLRKREGSLNERMFGALKTALMMTLTSIMAIAISLFAIYSISEVLRQIFTILLIGLGFDIFNTWITNASILRWYAEAKKIT